MEEALTALLVSDAAMASIFDGRIHWGRKPQSVTGAPYLVMQVISWPNEYRLNGAEKLAAARVQFDVYGKTYLEVRDGAKALATVMSGCRRRVAGVLINAGFIDARRDFNETSPGDDSPLFRRSTDIIVWHTTGD